MFKYDSPRDAINFITIKHIDSIVCDPFGNSENLQKGFVSMVSERLEKRLTYIALTLGVIAIAGSLLIGVNIVSVTTAEIEEQFEQFYLTKARSLAALSVPALQSSDSTLLGQIYEVWTMGQNLPADEYICVVNHSSELILHSSVPQSIGEDVGQNLLTEPWKDTACTLGDIVKVPRDYVGGYISSSGENQIAAFAPLPDRGWVIGIHRSKRILHDTIRAKLNAQIWGMLSISLGIIPLALGLFYFSFIRINRERKQAEKALRESEERFKLLFDKAPLGYQSLNREGQFIEVNQTWLDTLGYTREEVIGKWFGDFMTPDSQEKVRQRFPGFVKNGKVHTEFELIHKNGNILTISFDGRIGHDLKGDFKQTHCILNDITERKQAERALAESNSLRELLLDIITHDLKNPAGVIYALSEAAQQDMPENKFLETIYTSSRRLMDVLNRTTVLSQATFGETIPKEALSLNTLLQETVDEYASALRTAEMECVVAIAPDVIIVANPLIREVFKNYISNAIKYARDGKRIVIETVIDGQTAIVRVKDFGKTIAEADRERIFERRVQLKEGEKRGRGLGLAIVKRIAEAHGGEVWVEPNTPHGNSFCLRIPL